MIISRTPFRIPFLGGGTDHPAWYREHGGAVIAATIDKYCYLTCRYLPPFFEHRYRIVYSKIENVESLDAIQHPAVRAILKYLQIPRGVEIHHRGDLPARSGIGSDSSFSVGLLHALYSLQGKMVSKHKLAMDGIRVEQDLLRETVGSQDQVLAAYGGLNHVRFLPSGEIGRRPIIMPVERVSQLNRHIMLFYTGIKCADAALADTCADVLEREPRRQLRIQLDLVKEGLSILSGDRDLCAFGELLHEAWLVERSLSPPNARGDDIYAAARSAGAVGGKILGTGDGGFLMFYAPPEHQEAIRQKLPGFIHVPCQFEFEGSQIIFFDRETDYSREEESRNNVHIEPFEENAEPHSRDNRIGADPGETQ